MAKCPHCGQRKGKRPCPALEASICTVCCGQHRGREIACPTDCPYFVEAEGSESLAAAFTAANAKLVAAMERREAWCAQAARAFFGGTPRAIQEWEQPSLLGYMAYGFADENGERFVDHYLREAGPIKLAESKALGALRQVWYSLFEVQAIELDHGLDLLDLLSEQRVFVHEKLGTHDLVKFDLLLLWVAPLGEQYVMTGPANRVPRGHKAAMLKAMRGALTRARKKRPDASTQALSLEIVDTAHRALIRSIENTPRPTLVTTEGDEVVFCEAIFDVRDAEPARQRLLEHPEFEAYGDEALHWINQEQRVQLGAVRLKGGRLVLQTRSRERLELGKALISAHLGELVHHRLDKLQDVEAALAEARERGELDRPPPAQIPPDVQAQLLCRFLQDHLTAWLDEQIPALDGKTPREACRTARGREKVAALLKEQEHSAQRMPGGDRVDFAAFYAELGLER